MDGAGEVQDLTVRSFGILSARDTPPVDVVLHPSGLWPVNASDAVFAATAAAAWLADGLHPEWPTSRGRPSGRAGTDAGQVPRSRPVQQPVVGAPPAAVTAG